MLKVLVNKRTEEFDEEGRGFFRLDEDVLFQHFYF